MRILLHLHWALVPEETPSTRAANEDELQLVLVARYSGGCTADRLLSRETEQTRPMTAPRLNYC